MTSVNHMQANMLELVLLQEGEDIMQILTSFELLIWAEIFSSFSSSLCSVHPVLFCTTTFILALLSKSMVNRNTGAE